MRIHQGPVCRSPLVSCTLATQQMHIHRNRRDASQGGRLSQDYSKLDHVFVLPLAIALHRDSCSVALKHARALKKNLENAAVIFQIGRTQSLKAQVTEHEVEA